MGASRTTALLLSVLSAGALLAGCAGEVGSQGSPPPVATETAATEPPATEPAAPTSYGPVVLADLTDSYGCGFGFQAGNPEQTAGIFFRAESEDLSKPPVTTTVDLAGDGVWVGELAFGTDLFANWCDDVIELGEPEPVIDERWPVVAGALEFAGVDTEAQRATVTATGLVAVAPDGTRHDLGDITLVNSAWGQFAG